MRRLIHPLARLLPGLRTAWLILGVTLLVALLLEGALGLVRRAKRASDRAAIAAQAAFAGADWAPAYVDELSTGVTARWQPYVQWRAAPFAGRYINIDAAGLRRTAQFAPPAAPSRPALPVVWLFGGSVAWGWGARDDSTIASDLARDLAAAGRPVHVVNRAQIGYVSTQDLLALLDELRAGRRPDVAIFLSGYNDLMAAIQEGVAGLPQNESNRRAEFNRGLPAALAASVDGSATMWFVKALLRRAGLQHDPRAAASTPGSSTLGDLARSVAQVYAANLAQANQLGRDHGFQVFTYWQPTAFSKKNLVGGEHEAAHWWPAVADLLTGVRRELATLPALGSGQHFRDLTGLFDDAPQAIFLDTCHFAEPGHQQVAAEMVSDLAPLLSATTSAGDRQAEGASLPR